MKALVTGGAGFIGHHLVRALVARGDDVAVIDDYSTGDPARLDPLRSQIMVVEGSILDPDALDAAMRGREVVFHEGALPSVARSLLAPLASNEVNVTGTIQVMLAAARAGARRVVYAGSSSVYGIPKTLPCSESFRPGPESPYGVSKLAAELYVHTMGRHHGIATAALRYFNVFGEGQDPRSEYAAVIPRFVTALLTGQRPTVNGDGSVSRDFTHIDNVVAANLLAARDDAPTGITCNIACGERRTLLDLLRSIQDAAGRSVEPIFGPARAGDIQHSMADITAAREGLGYQVVVPFDEGIRRTVAWYQAGSSGSHG
ncbi:MAG: NAD-dependent epimerase/dehydratase family protein [Chloroflexota bacterium]